MKWSVHVTVIENMVFGEIFMTINSLGFSSVRTEIKKELNFLIMT